MKEVYQTLKDANILYLRTQHDTTDFLKELEGSCQSIHIASNEDEAKNIMTSPESKFNLVISDINLSHYNPSLAFFLLSTNELKLTQFLSILASKVQHTTKIKKITHTTHVLSKMLKEEKTKSQKIATFASTNNSKLQLLDYIVDELLVKFEINKDGVVTSTSKNFAEIFGFREEYIINEKIEKIIHGSSLQKNTIRSY
jgi:menaquinone-dependent protoporphyrinogen IX oxidase